MLSLPDTPRETISGRKSAVGRRAHLYNYRSRGGSGAFTSRRFDKVRPIPQVRHLIGLPQDRHNASPPVSGFTPLRSGDHLEVELIHKENSATLVNFRFAGAAKVWSFECKYWHGR